MTVKSLIPTRRQALVGAAAAALPAASAAAAARPDIVLIVLDDAGYSDLGCFGSEIRTPAMDALAASGLRYTSFDTKALCSPTRAALLTGRNPQTLRMADLPSRLQAPDPADLSKTKGELPANVETVADALRGAGYGTYAVGKWHLSPAYEGGPDEAGPGGRKDPGGAKRSWPLQRGFDQFYGFLGGWTDQWSPTLVRNNALVAPPQRPDYHLSADLADHAIEALDAGRASGKPSFLYLAFGAPHSPLQPPADYLARYEGLYDKGWDAIRQERFERMKRMGIVPADTVLTARSAADPAWDTLGPEQRRVFARYMAAYAGFLEHADAQIGRLVDHLKATGRLDNTLVVLMSDNGAAGEAGLKGGFRKPYGDPSSLADVAAHLDEMGGPTTKPLYPRPWAWVGSTPFRETKASLYAGGVRTPLIVAWPAGIKAAGAIRRQPVDVVDLAPTLLDVAGARFSPSIGGVTQIPVAGASLRATFSSSTAGVRNVQYFELRADRAIRVGVWRAVAVHKAGTPFELDRWELFNTAADPSEATDLSSRYPRKLEELQQVWWREAKRHADPPLNEFVPPHARGRASSAVADRQS